MLTVTEIAQKQIAKFFEENALRPVRIFLSNGCTGPQKCHGLG
jgi:Fe-S cluster assembly iron-binding protein IscA